MKRRWSAVLTMVAGTVLSATVLAQQNAVKAVPKDEARERNLRAYTELLRSDLRTQKVALITELMQFTDSQDEKFWPVYREYENEVRRLNDDRLKNLQSYADSYTTLNDAQADSLVVKALDLEARRTALRQKYYAALKKALPARVAARAVQIEHQVDLLIDLQVAASLPIVEPK
jgi:hypothetical protein